MEPSCFHQDIALTTNQPGDTILFMQQPNNSRRIALIRFLNVELDEKIETSQPVYMQL